MSLLLIRVLTMSAVWKGCWQLGGEQVQQFDITPVASTATYSSRQPGFLVVSPWPPAITQAVSLEGAETSTRPVPPPPSQTPSLQVGLTGEIPTAAPAAGEVTSRNAPPTAAMTTADSASTTAAADSNVVFTTAAANGKAVFTTASANTNGVYTTAAANTNGVYTTAAANTHGVFTTAAANTNAVFTTAAANTNAVFNTAAANTNAVFNTAAANTNAVFNTAAANTNGVFATAAADTNSVSTPADVSAPNTSTRKSIDGETKTPPTNSKGPASRTPPAISAETRPTVAVMKFNDQDDVDYNYDEGGDEDVEDAKKKRRGDVPNCSYDPCAHLQRPCLEMSQGSCRCPGLTPDSSVPVPPLTVDAQDVTSSSAEIRWCAPPSSVSGYVLEVQPEGGGAPTVHAVGPTFRRFRVTGLQGRRAYTICTRAKNRAGSSPPTCTALTTGAESCAVILYALAGLAAGLALLALALAVCLCQQCRKPPPENPRASSLISIPNPAYCHPQKRADIFKI